MAEISLHYCLANNIREDLIYNIKGMTTHNTVRSGSAALAVGDSGTGSPIVFLHAGVADRRAWRPCIDALAGMMGSFRAIAYDRRGFGETVFTKERYSRVADLIAVLDACEIEQAVLVGNSQGGRVAIDAAISHPDRVRALVLIGTAVSGAPDVETYAPATQQLIERIEAAENAGDLDAVNRLEAHLWLDGPSTSEGRVGGTARSLFLNMNNRALLAGDAGVVTDEIDAWNLLPTLKIPVSILIGDLDLSHLLDRSRQMSTAIAVAELVVLDGCAHMPALESPTRCARLIADFLDRRALT